MVCVGLSKRIKFAAIGNIFTILIDRIMRARLIVQRRISIFPIKPWRLCKRRHIVYTFSDWPNRYYASHTALFQFHKFSRIFYTLFLPLRLIKINLPFHMLSEGHAANGDIIISHSKSLRIIDLKSCVQR